jgi:ADP-ribose pyrophosphatase YjhB (NUDIX family)
MFTIGVFAIITDGEGRVLLCHRRDRDVWNLPGGGLEKGEAPWDGVVREVREETGLDVSVRDLVGVYSKPEVDEVVFSFVCVVTGGVIASTCEADMVQYFRLDAIPEKTLPRQVERIRDALISPNALTLKIQWGSSMAETSGL